MLPSQVTPKRQDLVKMSTRRGRHRQPCFSVAILAAVAEERDGVSMRSSTALVLAMTVTACSGTDGDILHTRSDARPQPQPLASWQIQLSGNLDTTVDVRVYIADAGTPTSVIADLHAAGRIVICYFSAGTQEPFRGDAARFPAASLGEPVASYPDERWIDVRDPTVRAIMQDRITAAAAAGCDGIEASGLAAFAATTGFDFTRADQVGYARSLAAAVHRAGFRSASSRTTPAWAGTCSPTSTGPSSGVAWTRAARSLGRTSPRASRRFWSNTATRRARRSSVPGRALSGCRRSSRGTATWTRSASAVPSTRASKSTARLTNIARARATCGERAGSRRPGTRCGDHVRTCNVRWPSRP